MHARHSKLLLACSHADELSRLVFNVTDPPATLNQLAVAAFLRQALDTMIGAPHNRLRALTSIHAVLREDEGHGMAGGGMDEMWGYDASAVERQLDQLGREAVAAWAEDSKRRLWVAMLRTQSRPRALVLRQMEMKRLAALMGLPEQAFGGPL